MIPLGVICQISVKRIHLPSPLPLGAFLEYSDSMYRSFVLIRNAPIRG